MLCRVLSYRSSQPARLMSFWTHHSTLPDSIISDRGPQFATQSFQELLKLLNVKSHLSTTYHPQTDGATKWVNQEIEAYLAIYCANHLEDWHKSLSTLEFTHNNRRHAHWLHTLFELILGDSLHPNHILIHEIAIEKMKKMITDREEAPAAHELAQARMANRKSSSFI